MNRNVHHFLQYPLNKVKPLLSGKAGHYRRNGNAWVNVKIKLVLKRGLAFRLAAHIFRAIVAAQRFVRKRIIGNGVYAVEYAHNVPRALRKHALERFAVELGHYLLCICWGYGGNLVRVYYAAFKIVHVAVELQLVHIKRRFAEGEQFVAEAAIEHALKPQVMYCKYCFYAGEIRHFSIVQLHKRGGHCRLPVVQVQRIGHEAYVRQHLYYGLGEKAEALRLVAIEHAVNIIPPEIVFVIYEVICYAALNKAFNPAVLIAPAKLYVKIALVAHMHAELRLYLGV